MTEEDYGESPAPNYDETVPAGPEYDDASVPEPVYESTYEPPGEKKDNKVWIILAIVAAVLCLCCICLVAAYYGIEPAMEALDVPVPWR